MKRLDVLPGYTHRTASTCSLSGLSIGACGRVISVSGDQECRRRLLEMGFCNGALVKTIRRAPPGDPIEFRLRGYCLCLHEEQAQCITVTQEPPSHFV